jgi:hypothetical protein
MTQETKDFLLVDILKIMRDSGKSVNEMVIVVQSYISEMGFLDDEGSLQVKEILKIKV